METKETICNNEGKDSVCLLGPRMWFHIDKMGFNENYSCVNPEKCFRFSEKK